MDVKDWVVIVTGSATGIGAATARLLAKGGARVVVNYTRSEKEARETAEACEAMGSEALLCRADVSKDEDCRRMAAEAIKRWGRIDGLVNNAGTTKFVAHDNLEGLTAEDFQRIFAVNVVGVYQMTRAVVPHMKAQGAGSVVNISSIAAIMGIGSSIAYAASKGAVNTLTLSLARALGPEIRVNAVCPGFVQGRWLRGGLGDEAYEAHRRAAEKQTPLRRAGTPEDMAETALWFLAGNRNITGEILTCDAGTHLGGGGLRQR